MLLKKCKFCGSLDLELKLYEPGFLMSSYLAYVRCRSCEATGPSHKFLLKTKSFKLLEEEKMDGTEKAVEMWNGWIRKEEI
jgi:hypothetical protein